MVRPRPVPPAAAPAFVCVKASKMSREGLGLDADAGVADLEGERARPVARDAEPHFAAAR